MMLLRSLKYFVFIVTFFISLTLGSNVKVLLPPSRPPSKPIPGNSPIEVCDITLSQGLIIESIDLTPNPPARGSELVLEASGLLLDSVLEGSYVDVEVRLGYIKLVTQRFDLCDILRQEQSKSVHCGHMMEMKNEKEDDNDDGGDGPIVCPVPKGPHKISKTVKIPKEVPMGRYTFIVRAYTQDNSLLTCLTGDFLISMN